MYLARRFEEAAQVARKTLDMDRSFIYSSLMLAMALERLGRNDQAIAELERVRAEGWGQILIELACAHAAAGRREPALRMLDEARSAVRRQFVDPGAFSYAYAELHNVEESIRWLQKALDEKSELITFAKVEPKWDPIRSDPRFGDILRRAKLV